MSPSHLRCGVRAGAIATGVAAVAMASVHFSGHHFSDDVATCAVEVVILVAGIWLVVEGICLVVDRIDRFRAEAQTRFDALRQERTDAESIAARAIQATYGQLGDSDGADVVNGDFSRRRR